MAHSDVSWAKSWETTERTGVAMRSHFLFIALLVSSACGQQDRGELRDELRKQSARNGLALAEAIAGHVTVIPFDGPVKYFESDYRFPITTFGKGGQMVLWWSRSDFLGVSGEYVIDSMDGQSIAKGRTSVIGFHPVSLSEAGGRIAFFGTPNPGLPDGLYWAPFDFSSTIFVDSTTTFPDWSPDGNSLVYGKEDQIYTFNVQSGTSKALVRGHDPTWSPDGKRIAYVGPDGRASVTATDGAPVQWRLSSHKPLTAMRWSPDGRYVSFPVRTDSLPLNPFGVAYRLLVCRVSDGKTAIAEEFDGGATSYAAFQWIVNYRKFCRSCAPSP